MVEILALLDVQSRRVIAILLLPLQLPQSIGALSVQHSCRRGSVEPAKRIDAKIHNNIRTMRASSQLDDTTRYLSPPHANDDDGDEDGNNVVVLGSAEQQQGGQSMTSLLYNAVHNPNQVMAMLSNYSTSYNAANVGIALPVLNYYMRSLSSSRQEQQQQQQQQSEYYSSPEQRSLVDDIRDQANGSSSSNNNESQNNSSLVASSLMAGMIIGQLLGGILGDILGRKTAMILVMILQIGGSLGSSAIFVGSTTNNNTDDDDDDGLTALKQLAIWRFILGVGAGGVYPLAAVMSAETTTTNEKQERDEISAAAVNTAEYHGVVEEREDSEQNDNDTVSSFQRMALTFSTQGLGFITVPLLAYPMLELGVDTNIIWRVLLGMGAVPGIVVLYLTLKDNYCGQRRTIETEEIMIAVTANNTPTEESLRNEDDDIMTATVESTIAGSDVSNERALIDNSYLEDNNDTTATTNRRCRHTMRGSKSSRGLWESIKAEPGLTKKLVGTAGTWFLFDIVFYGNVLFEPVVLEAAFGSSSAAASAAGTNNNNTDDFGVLRTVVRDSLVISCLSLPGYFITVALIGRRTCVNMCRSIRSSFASTRFGSAMCCPPYYDQTPGKFLLG